MTIDWIFRAILFVWRFVKGGLERQKSRLISGICSKEWIPRYFFGMPGNFFLAILPQNMV